MIRPAVKNKINNLLGNGYFSSHDFTITSDTDNRGDILTINYLYGEYSFSAKLPSSTTSRKDDYGTSEYYIIKVEMTPGFIATSETIKFDNFNEFYSGIKQWIERVRDDLSSIPFQRELDKQNKEIENLKEKISDISDEPFTDEEIDKIKEGLNSLEDDFKKRIKDDIQDKTKLKDEIDFLHAEIQALKDLLASLNKPNWYHVASAKIVNWMNNPSNIKLLKGGTKIISNLITDNTMDGASEE